MNKILKKILALVLTIIIMIGMLYVSNATTHDNEMLSLIQKDWKDTTNTTEKINPIMATVITAIRVAAVAIAVVMLLVIAMKYMTAAPGDRADIKKSAIVYVVGAIVLFGVTQILSIISNFALAIK